MDPILSMCVVLGLVFFFFFVEKTLNPTQPDSYKSLFKSINLQKRYIEILM